MEVEIPNTDIEIVDSTDIEVITTVDVIGNVSNDLEITFDDNEYSIVGDDMVVMTNYDDAPQWLKDTIGNIVNIKTAIAIGDLDATKEALDVMLRELEVAKNTYELSIISSEDIDERITTAITTLNSSLREADATILQIAQTAVTPEEATTISINTLNASLSSNGTIGSAIHQLNVAMSTLENTTAESLSYLSSTMEGEINGNAEAMQTIRTYVGIDENGNNTGVGLLTDVEILQKQNDGIIETITGTYDVMLGIEDPNNNTDNDQLDVTKEPYASWLAEDVANGNIAKRSAHVGDVYIKYSSSDSGYKSYEKAYKFIRTVVDTTSPYATDSAGFTWSLIVDTDAQNAYVAALNAYDLADDKRRVFVSTPYAPIDEGDLWVTGTNPQVVKVYKSGDWVLADTQTIEFANEINPKIDSLQSQVDGQISYYFFDSGLGQSAASVSGSSSWTTDALKKEHNGDIAYDTKLELGYWYDRSVSNWVQITGAQNAGVIEALKKAAEAKEAADDVIVSYYAWKQTTAPATQYKWMKDDNTLWEYVGSTWVVVDVKKDDTLTAYNNTTKDTTLYVHNGSVWTMITPNGIVASSKAVTDLNASLSSLDTTVSGHTSLLNTVDTRIGAEGARVETKFAYNSTVNIGGIYKKSGFGLTTNYTSGSGTLADPYVSEFWIDASRFKFTNSNVTGSVAPFSIDASGATPEITFNGKVTFGSGQTGTIDEAIAAVVETVAVGDKNINITDNLIPITSLVADTDNSGYQFVGTPTKSNASGIDTFAEAQIVLDGVDEVYSPYVDDVNVSYYYRFGIKGVSSNFNVFNIVAINGSNVSTSTNVVATLDVGQVLDANNWYIVEGLINPTGGNFNAVGSIRNSSGIKIGTVNSFVLPSGTVKLVLGWVANCTISRMKLCKVTADTVMSDLTTVNGQIASLQTDISNISWDSLQGKDLMAQQLGYSNYSELATAATNGNTVINGGYLNTDLINANAISANQINTAGLVAETISASEIVGKTLTGSVINGASISGSVIKASYLDLDGELEVLTNYHITPAMYNANPSLYTDAVYMSGTNEYRIPSISTVREESKTQDISINEDIFNSKIRSYNCANAGHNLKCVKNITSFTCSGGILLLTISNPTQAPHEGFMFSSNKVKIYIGGVDIGLDVQYVYNHVPSNYDGEGFGTPEFSEYYWLLNGSRVSSITINGFNFSVEGNRLYLNAGTYNMISNFTDIASSLIKLKNIGGWNVKWYGQEYTYYYSVYHSSSQSINTAYMSTNLVINNMI